MIHRRVPVHPHLLLSVAAFLILAVPGADAQPRATHSADVFRFTDGGDDLANRVATDAVGNFYVAAALDDVQHPSGFAVLKYDQNGTLQGVSRYKPGKNDGNGVARKVAVDTLGNIYAVGDTRLGGIVVSFSADGKQRWAQHFSDSGIALALDADGNVYAAGTHVTGDFTGEWVVVKYASDGQLLWQTQHTGAAGGDVRLTDIQVDADGNPIVLGTTDILVNSVTNTMTTWKLDPQGATQWIRDFVAVQGVGQVPAGFATDKAGDVFVTGTTEPPEGQPIDFTVKYDAAGQRDFVLKGKGSGGASVAIDPSGDVLLAGIHAILGRVPVMFASKFHPDGTRVWFTKLAAAQKILSDSAGNIYVAGSILNGDTANAGPADYLLYRLSSAGAVTLKTRVKAGDFVSDAAVDSVGNLIVTGTAQNVNFRNDIVSVRVNHTNGPNAK